MGANDSWKMLAQHFFDFADDVQERRPRRVIASAFACHHPSLGFQDLLFDLVENRRDGSVHVG